MTKSHPDAIQHRLTHSYCKCPVSEWLTRAWKDLEMLQWKSVCVSTLSSVSDSTKTSNRDCIDLKIKLVLVLLHKLWSKFFAVILQHSFMFSMLSFCCWHPSVIWRNSWCFSFANISARTDSGPRWPVSCKPPNHHPPTCCHIWDLLYTNTKWLILVQERNRPGPSVSSIAKRPYLCCPWSTWPQTHLAAASLSSYPDTVWNVLPGSSLCKHSTWQEISRALWKIRCHYCVHTY